VDKAATASATIATEVHGASTGVVVLSTDVDEDAIGLAVTSAAGAEIAVYCTITRTGAEAPSDKPSRTWNVCSPGVSLQRVV
jgi:hypothetical protein